ncbi:conjugative transposon protein TraN [Flavobacterium sp. JAS]|uniref:conjugative transposon protein TraN n=1 Tax=Flavobacterium sp. JAS TaxID=2897329 RepID=UPI001E339330|nr:conjugative transposon protein TraN [Flavobacterium sp. JAS]MCD0470597.1 conjugative transposon protein TraN [Flavobacterium sp. JAS]
MKNIKLWLVALPLVMTLMGFAQQSGGEEANVLELGYSKTTSIVFPYPVRSVDKGSGDILVQKAKGVENMLLVKAAKVNFTQTNLTVVTSDGRLYGFVVNFNEQCPVLSLRADDLTAVNGEILFSSEHDNQEKIKQYAQLALCQMKSTSGLYKSKYDIKLELTGLFIYQEILYFRVELVNQSKINYQVDQLRFFIRDQKKSLRTAWQEIEINPIFCTSELGTIFDRSRLSVVFALPKFTIPQGKYLTIEVIEKQGERQLELNIKNKHLMDLEILKSL